MNARLFIGMVMVAVVSTAAFGAPVPTLTIDIVTGDAELDTAGLDLTAFQVMSKGVNGISIPAGDGDGYLTPDLPVLGTWLFENSSVDEYAGTMALPPGLPAGVYPIPGLYAHVPSTAADVLADVFFGYDAYLTGNVVAVPEPATLSVLVLGAPLALLRRRTR